VIFFGGMQRNPFRFQITPASPMVDYYFDLTAAPATLWNHVRSDGGDIRVLKEDGLTQVPREISAFDFGSQRGSLWIKGNAATSFWITYGNTAWTEPAAGATYGKSATWESALKLVLHGQDFSDSTNNAQSVSHSVGVTAAEAGKLRGALKSSIAGDYIAVQHNDSLVFTNLSFAAWINWTASAGGTGRIINKAYVNNGLRWSVQSDGTLSLCGYSTNVITASAASASAWHHVAFSLDSSGNTVQYIDGVEVKTGITETPSGLPAVELRFFNRDDGARSLTGSLDELRVYNRILGGAEIAAMYANQNSPATFWTIGSEQQG
jgi:biopolymer transport protein ExbB